MQISGGFSVAAGNVGYTSARERENWGGSSQKSVAVAHIRNPIQSGKGERTEDIRAANDVLIVGFGVRQ